MVDLKQKRGGKKGGGAEGGGGAAVWYACAEACLELFNGQVDVSDDVSADNVSQETHGVRPADSRGR